MKSSLAALAVVFLLTGSALAAGPDGNQCDANKVAGTYLRNRPAAFSGSGFGVLDQLVLTSDGTAYWYQTTSFDLLITGGTFIPEVGSWQCLDKSTIAVTTIGANYFPNGAGDIVKANYDKFSQKLTIQDDNTLQVVLRISRTYALTDDPLTGTPLTKNVSTNTTSPYRRVTATADDVTP